MSINDLVKEEAQRQIDLAIEEIPSDSSRLARSRFQYKNLSDFLLGFEYGHITGMYACYYHEHSKQRNGPDIIDICYSMNTTLSINKKRGCLVYVPS